MTDSGFPPGDYPTSASFDLVAPHYDALMRGVPYSRWIEYLEQLVGTLVATSPHASHIGTPLTGTQRAAGGTQQAAGGTQQAASLRVLDLACGTGSASAIMAAKGWDVVGVDLSEKMIAEAERKTARKKTPVRFYAQDAAALDLPGPPFDLCVSFFDSLNYIAEPARLALAIERVAAHLRPAGLFVFDMNSAYALRHAFFDQENSDSRARLRYVWRSEFDEASRLCRVRMRFFWRNSRGVDEEFREEHVQFAYEESEVRAMLLAAGFEEIETFHAYTLRPVRATSDRIFYLAQKR